MAELIRLRDAERELGISRHTLRRYIREGALPAVRLPGGHFRIDAAQLQRFKREYRMPNGGSA